MLKNLIKKLLGRKHPSLPNIDLIKNFKIENTKKPIKNILIATSSGGLFSSLVFESLLGNALKFKNCNVEFLICDSLLPACIMATEFNIDEKSFLKKGPKKICSSCYYESNRFLKESNFKINKLSDFFDENDQKYQELIKQIDNINLENVKDFKINDIPLGVHAHSGALRYYARTDLDYKKNANETLKKFLIAALKTQLSTEKLFSKKSFDTVILNHGIYVPQGVIHEVSKKNNINTVNYCLGTRKKTFCFCKDETYHKALIYEDNQNWEKIELNKKAEEKLNSYLKSRLHGNQDWIYFHNKPNFDLKSCFKKYNIDINKPLIGLATNVIWDAQIDFPSNFFKNILNWLFYTIDFFVKNENLQLLIRVHPAEVNSTKPAKQRVLDEIKKHYKSLPNNIKIIPPEDNVSTYTVMEACDSILIYGSRLGVELSAMNIPVIVCGEGFIRNKGIGIDINSFEDYDKILKKLPLNQKLSLEKLERAKKYAYHFFFRRMIEINSIDEKPDKWPNIDIKKDFYVALQNKTDIGLEVITKNIIEEKDFILEDKKTNL